MNYSMTENLNFATHSVVYLLNTFNGRFLCTIKIRAHKINGARVKQHSDCLFFEKVQVGKDQEKAQ